MWYLEKQIYYEIVLGEKSLRITDLTTFSSSSGLFIQRNSTLFEHNFGFSTHIWLFHFYTRQWLGCIWVAFWASKNLAFKTFRRFLLMLPAKIRSSLWRDVQKIVLLSNTVFTVTRWLPTKYDSNRKHAATWFLVVFIFHVSRSSPWFVLM